jgi:hypothetical protein
MVITGGFQPMHIAATPTQIQLAVVEKKHTERTRQDEYVRYLQSQRWRTLARAVRMRARGKCEICLRADGEECAHLTYERVFNERISDLLWVCKKCHRHLDDGR